MALISRCAMDLTLQQTVNKDAASRKTGIGAFTQCVKAGKRWTVCVEVLWLAYLKWQV